MCLKARRKRPSTSRGPISVSVDVISETDDYAPYELTPAGKVYCGFSSFDKSVWFRAQNPIQASNYIGVSDYTIQVRPSTDGEGLMLSRFSKDQYADYQVYVPDNAQILTLRYAAL